MLYILIVVFMKYLFIINYVVIRIFKGQILYDFAPFIFSMHIHKHPYCLTKDFCLNVAL